MTDADQKDLAQIRLTNGSEIVCEVMEWPREQDNQMIMRNAMAIICYDHADGDTSYAFRPFVHFLNDETDYVVVNVDHVLSYNRPTEYLTEQYQVAVNEALMNAERRNRALKRDKIEGLARLAKALVEMHTNDGLPEEEEPIPDNVIPFPTNDEDTIH